MPTHQITPSLAAEIEDQRKAFAERSISDLALGALLAHSDPVVRALAEVIQKTVSPLIEHHGTKEFEANTVERVARELAAGPVCMLDGGSAVGSLWTDETGAWFLRVPKNYAGRPGFCITPNRPAPKAAPGNLIEFIVEPGTVLRFGLSEVEFVAVGMP